jgi:hypothetical protein
VGTSTYECAEDEVIVYSIHLLPQKASSGNGDGRIDDTEKSGDPYRARMVVLRDGGKSVSGGGHGGEVWQHGV